MTLTVKVNRLWNSRTRDGSSRFSCKFLFYQACAGRNESYHICTRNSCKHCVVYTGASRPHRIRRASLCINILVGSILTLSPGEQTIRQPTGCVTSFTLWQSCCPSTSFTVHILHPQIGWNSTCAFLQSASRAVPSLLCSCFVDAPYQTDVNPLHQVL